MLTKRVIPVMLDYDGQLVISRQFQPWRVVGHPLQAIQVHNARNVDELVYLDIAATRQGRGPDFDRVAELSEAAMMPLTVGGGVRNVSDIGALLACGADKVAVGDLLRRDPAQVAGAVERFGAQAIVGVIDVIHRIVISGVRRMDLLDVCLDVVGEVLLLDSSRDGMMSGYNTPAIQAAAQMLSCPVIAASGCGTYAHMHDTLSAGASAVAAGAMFQFTDATPRGAAEALAGYGWEVRL